MRSSRLARAALLAGLVTAAAALPAVPATSAEASLVYVKDHDIWLANDDGSGAYRVTTDGTAANPWQSPSQADDGTIVAARQLPRSGPLYVLRQNGDLVRQVPLPSMQFGPFDPAVSPDGRTVAYSHGFARYVNGWLETGTDIRYARTDGSGGTENWPGVSTGATTPSWIDSGRVLTARGSLAYEQLPGQSPTQWWSDYDHYGTFGQGEDLSDGEVAGERVVMVRGMNVPNTLQLYRAVGRLGTPVPTCTVSDPADGPLGRKYADPTLSADGRRIFWQEGDGVWTATTPAGEGCDGWTIRKLIDGASAPDWGPAPVAPAPRSGVPAGPGPGLPPGNGGPVTPPVGGTTKPQPKPTGCAAQKAGPARERCRYQAAAKACGKQPKRRRAACVTAAKRQRAVAVCQRTKKGKALKPCLRRAKRIG